MNFFTFISDREDSYRQHIARQRSWSTL